MVARWHEVQQIHSKLMATDPTRYNAAPFYDMEELLQPTLDAIDDLYETDYNDLRGRKKAEIHKNASARDPQV